MLNQTEVLERLDRHVRTAGLHRLALACIVLPVMAFMVFAVWSVADRPVKVDASKPTPIAPSPTMEVLERQNQKQKDKIDDLTELLNYCRNNSWNTKRCGANSVGGLTVVNQASDDDNSDDSDDSDSSNSGRPSQVSSPPKAPTTTNPPKPDPTKNPVDEATDQLMDTIEDTVDAATGIVEDVPQVAGAN